MTDQGKGQPLSLQPMVHVKDMATSVAFYEALGAGIEHSSRDGDFEMMQVGSSRFGLLAHPPNPQQNEGQVEMNFETTEALEAVEQRLRAADVTIAQPATTKVSADSSRSAPRRSAHQNQPARTRSVHLIQRPLR